MITGMPRIAVAVNDFPRTVATFREKLGMPVVDLSEGSVEKLGARLAMCVPEGGSNIEIMSPADPEAPLSQSLQRFLDRRGEGLFALMLEAPDPDAEAEELSARGLNVLPLMAGAGGRDVHPNSTHGVLIRVYPVDSFKRPEEVPEGNGAQPAGLSGIARVVLAVHDLDDAVAVYGTKFGMEVGQSVVDSDRGVAAAVCTPPTGGSIELVSVVDGERPYAQAIAHFLAERREGMFAIVLQSGDLEATAGALAARGVEVRPAADAAPTGRVLELERSAMFGALVRIEGR